MRADTVNCASALERDARELLRKVVPELVVRRRLESVEQAGPRDLERCGSVPRRLTPAVDRRTHELKSLFSCDP